MHLRPSFLHLALLASSTLTIGVTIGLVACSSSSPSGVTGDAGGPASADGGPTDGYAAPAPDDAGPDPLAACTKDPGAPAVAVDPNSATDPTGGAAQFTLAKALDGFPAGAGKLVAGIRTESGSITCELDEAAAPLSVANFVGLARGTRPFKDAKGKWTTGHFYDGLLWHRVIPGFVIQGGDPDGVGTGGPGYKLVEENQVDEPLGTLAMAASNAVSGSQFYIVVGTGPKPNYNVFGKCDTTAAIAISNVARDRSDAPLAPVHMIKIEIARCP